MSLLYPKKLKFKKFHKIKNFKFEYKNIDLKFSNLGIKALESGYITANQIETVRRILKQNLRLYNKLGKIWICIFPFLSISKKPIEVRMGKGKGMHSFWACPVQKGRILFEFDKIPIDKLSSIIKNISNKLPLKIKLIKKC
jgi:large subunit ribosomal protein L16